MSRPRRRQKTPATLHLVDSSQLTSAQSRHLRAHLAPMLRRVSIDCGRWAVFLPFRKASALRHACTDERDHKSPLPSPLEFFEHLEIVGKIVEIEDALLLFPA